jgi:F-type H+-transporting ATPase subunit a
MAQHGSDPLSHVIDHSTIELPWWNAPRHDWTIELPTVLGVQVTRFMVMEVIVAVILAVVMIAVARHMARNHVSRGWFMNMFEAMLLFVRDEVARPTIGDHDSDRFLPYLWTVFFFVLFSNLLGLVPGMASATGNINVTGVLALMTFVVIVAGGSRQLGVVGFWKALVPPLDVPGPMKLFLVPLMFVIEVSGLLIRNTVLAVRLFANMLAGHVVLAVILGFILTANSWLWYLVMPSSVIGVILLSLLEVLVAFIQAYIFVFLSAIFIGSAVHPH